MSEITPFTFPTTGQAVRTLLVDGEPWFVAADVCSILGHSDPTKAMAMVDEEDRVLYRRSDTPNFAEAFTDLRIQSVNLVNESGLYSLILRSNVAGARGFKRWVTHEVLPTIRRTGSYVVAPMELPRSFADALELAAKQARELEQAQERATVAEHQLHEIEPAARNWTALADAKGDYSLREAGQILSRDPLITIGQNQLMIYLKDTGWVDQKGEPYQHQVNAGRLVRRSTSYDHPHTGEPKLSYQVRITPKGLAELHRRLGGFGDVANVVAA